MTYIPIALRRFVSERAGYRCEYCLLPEEFSSFPHEPDHIIPLKHSGATAADNLALACFWCNRLKGSEYPLNILGERTDFGSLHATLPAKIRADSVVMSLKGALHRLPKSRSPQLIEKIRQRSGGAGSAN